VGFSHNLHQIPDLEGHSFPSGPAWAVDQARAAEPAIDWVLCRVSYGKTRPASREETNPRLTEQKPTIGVIDNDPNVADRKGNFQLLAGTFP
jgi:hypothetical protein